MNNNKIDIFAIGGLEEIGKNMYCIQLKNEIIIIDAGIKFPENKLLGIDYIIPDYNYLIKNKHKIKLLIITHGHEDHIGGIPFLLKHINIKIFAGSFAISLIKNKLEEHNLSYKNNLLNLINENKIINYKNFKINFFKVNHSIPDAFGIIIKTFLGNIVITGDFKFDLTPIDKPANLYKMAEIGNKGVLCLLSDSTNSEINEFTKSEKEIGLSLKKIIEKINNRIILASFASNIFRLQQTINAAISTNRKIIIFGRSMENTINNSKKLKYINFPKNTFINKNEFKRISPNKIMILCTGSQGEPMAALTRIANKTHKHISIIPGDTVIFSSSPIPGNNTNINKLINSLYELGANVIYGKFNNTHTSGHGGQEELKLMLNLIKPKFFIPVHGEFRMLKKHYKLAQDVGIPKKNCFIMKNGDILTLNKKNAFLNGSIKINNIYIDGNGNGEVNNKIITTRNILSKKGILIISITIDIKNKIIISGPEIISKGFISKKNFSFLFSQIKKISFYTIIKTFKKNLFSKKEFKKNLTNILKIFLIKKIKCYPIILPIIINI